MVAAISPPRPVQRNNMFDARHIPAADQPPVAIRVEDYEHDKHRGKTLCGDFNCGARLYYRREGRKFGDLISSVPHFATMPKDKHIENCTHHNPDTETRTLRSIQIALREGRKILINLNIDTGLSLGDDFGPAADPYDTRTAYGRFLARANHLALSAKSANDLLRYRAALLRSDVTDALAQTYVGHRHELRKFENVFIANDKKKLKKLFNSLAAGEGVMMQGPQQMVTGFPRLFLFEPTKKTQAEGARTGKINGTAQCISDVGEPGVILLQNLGMRDRTVRRDILENSATYILAAPTLNRAAAVKPAGKGASFVTLNWQIHGESQYAADPAAPKLL